MVNWAQESILVTGGTGSFGKKFVEIMLRDYHPQRLVVFSRDELKQHEMRTAGPDHPSMRYFIGDVRDVERLKRAFSGVTWWCMRRLSSRCRLASTIRSKRSRRISWAAAT